ncbi:hypothetical protein A2U01_0036756 [Trifolium medium]|uniref:Uncharacterized protein n=1 Tax=Trifolium medium TaxID=97028 RepID=A0A392PU56_9FABA|nr:hypothetical protein [Trifolium medium]
MDDSTMLPQDIIVTHPSSPRRRNPNRFILSLLRILSLDMQKQQRGSMEKHLHIQWPSLLSNGPLWLSEMISMFPGGDYRSFFFNAFPSIHHRNNPRPPPTPHIANFTYALIYSYKVNENLCIQIFNINA